MRTCSKCGESQIIIEKKDSGLRLCQECFIQFTQERVFRTIRKYRLIEKGDTVLLGLSGGKDSVMLLEILNKLRERRIINLVALTIDEGIPGYREAGIEIAKKNTKKYGIKHKIVTFQETLGTTLSNIMEDREFTDFKGACTYCGVFRRRILNQIARSEGATKIATGHNLDDETQSILMNYLEGNIENLIRIGPISKASSDIFIPKIKPLREIPEREVGLYVVARDLPVHFASCPYAVDSFRMEVGTFIKQISRDRPTLMYSTLRGFEKIKNALQKEHRPSKNLKLCRICKEPATGELCKGCTFLNKWKNYKQN